MYLTKLKIATVVLLLAGVLAGGLGTLVPPLAANGQTDARQPPTAGTVPKGTDKAKKGQQPTRWKERIKVDRPADNAQTFGVAISPDGKRIAVCYGTTTTVFDATTGQEVAALPGEQPATAIAFSPDGKLIARADRSDLLLCAADSGEVKATLEGPMGIRSVAFAPNGKTLAAAYGSADGGEVRLWDLATNKVLREFNKLPAAPSQEPRIWSLAFSGDGKKLATAQGSDNIAKVWDVDTGKELVALGKHPAWVIAVAFSPDGKTVAAANAGKEAQVKLWDVATGKERFTLKGPTGGYSSLAFSPDGKILAVAGEDDRDGNNAASVVRLWNAATGQQIAALDLQGDRTNWGTSLGFSRNGILVTASDAAVRVWEPESGPVSNKK
jgi:WD40 repeat protein